MQIQHQKFTIIRVRKPVKKDINNELQWLGNSLGLFNLRDKDKSCFRIFIELLKATRQNTPLSSDEIAYKLNLSRGTIIHHINKLDEAGIVVSQKNKYYLRVNNLENLINELEKDILRALDDLKNVAKEIDGKMGI
ncbi:winged helix-turn-helix transcriptional regulator [Candidatus Woesearchaeota archaeon]|jgi:biotin operon repressor|nr:winged helix-turn-helix transcriptional regulator [Candidatus Woesearchaeota archaeon]MBT6518679.1 winged helix-turn-helix transcriptional regulator [Candidatus Woesearchaeota archaeon]MBT7368868.1 winged helix-turn-helix transcriptional regulator [Candidatus Woesearchaeota archaeon]